MAPSHTAPLTLALSDLMAGFAESLPHAQQELDSDWVASRDHFLAALPPDVRNWVSLASGLSPVRQVVLESEIHAKVSFDREESDRWRLSVLNLAFERKFTHSDFVRHSVTMKVVAHSWKEEQLYGRSADGTDR